MLRDAEFRRIMDSGTEDLTALHTNSRCPVTGTGLVIRNSWNYRGPSHGSILIVDPEHSDPSKELHYRRLELTKKYHKNLAEKGEYAVRWYLKEDLLGRSGVNLFTWLNQPVYEEEAYGNDQVLNRSLVLTDQASD